MSTIAFSPVESRLHFPPLNSHTISTYDMVLEGSLGRRMSNFKDGAMAPTILLRKLPRNTSPEAVRTMLLFAKDLTDTEIIPNEFDEDIGFSTAIARFASMTGASEAQVMLDGKPNTAGQANMIVDVIAGPGYSSTGRRNTMDQTTSRKLGHSVSPAMSNAQKSSRFNGTFQSMEKLSPPLVGSPPEHSSSDASSHLQTIFSPQSPVANMLQDRSRISGKSIIGEAGGDDETGELLKDPLAYMNNTNASRKTPNARIPTAAFSALSLSTNVNNKSQGSFNSPRSAHSHKSHAFSPVIGPNPGYQVSGSHYLRHNYPPVNPADQNPPCNTLYVGNLPIDTSEDELKAMFSKQRGYKRLCFRTKQNGPMCFVEFEDISFATKALNELYGAQLHNSVKGGIRLSFSKNPLGVRAGQPGSSNPATPLSATGPMNMSSLNTMSPASFQAVNGPPPGLSVPPGFNMTMPGMNGTLPAPAMNAPFVNQGLGIGNSNINGARGMPMNGNSPGPAMNGMYPDYMMGR